MNRTMTNVSRSALPVSIVLLLALSLAACGEEAGEDEAEYGMETDTGFVRDPTMLDDPQRVRVTLDDYVIEMPDTVPSGTLVFEANNRGTQDHSLEVEGQGVHQALPDPADPGNTMELTVDLQPGTYRMYCPVGDHAERGMEKTIIVQ